MLGSRVLCISEDDAGSYVSNEDGCRESPSIFFFSWLQESLLRKHWVQLQGNHRILSDGEEEEKKLGHPLS